MTLDFWIERTISSTPFTTTGVFLKNRFVATQLEKTKKAFEASLLNKQKYFELLKEKFKTRDADLGRNIKDHTQRAAAFRYLLESQGVDMKDWATEFPPQNGVIGGFESLEHGLVPKLLDKKLDKELLEFWEKKDKTSFCNALKVKSKTTLLQTPLKPATPVRVEKVIR